MEELVKRVKEGNTEAYSELVKSVHSELYGIAMSRLRNEADVQDAIQETIIIAYMNIAKLKDDSNFKSWIIKILINQCNKIHNKKKRNKNIEEKYIDNNDRIKDLDDNIDFENMIESLNKKEQEIFKLYYEDGYNIKEIARKLDVNENTVKTNLSRGKLKIKKHYKPASIFMFILCIILATSVIAVSIIGYIKSLFETKSVGKVNDGVLMAIENMDWYQKVDMDYIDLGDGYKLKIEYILLDEMNLYMVYDIESEKDISKFTDVSITDLQITNEKGDVICNRNNIFAEQYSKHVGDKTIENDKHHIKSLLYMYTESFPICKTLNISFSNINFSKKSIFTKNNYFTINTDVKINIELDYKFISREHTLYKSNDNIIEKAMITETGFYAIAEIDRFKTLNIYLVDENNIKHKCYYATLTTDSNSSELKYIIISDFKDVQTSKIKIIINEKESNLRKE